MRRLLFVAAVLTLVACKREGRILGPSGITVDTKPLTPSCRVPCKSDGSCPAYAPAVGEVKWVWQGCVDGACVGPDIVALGEACDAARRCPYRSMCVGGRCAAMALLGEACGSAGCASGVCEGGVCVALADPSEGCDRHAQCRSGRCDDGRCAALSATCVR